MKDKNQYTGYIYCISNTDNDKLYVGQTITTINTRFKQHCHHANKLTKGQECLLHTAMRKHGVEKFSVHLLARITRDDKDVLRYELNHLEMYYISYFNCMKPNGYNMVPGGNWNVQTTPTRVFKVSENGVILNEYDSMSEAERLNGIPHGMIWISLKRRGYTNGSYWVKCSDYPNAQIGDNIGQRKSDNRIPVWQFDMDGNFIAQFDSIADASKSTGIRKSSISKACPSSKNPRKNTRLALSAGGFLWSTDGSVPDNTPKKNPNMKAIRQLSLDGDEIQIFESEAAAKRYLGITGSSVSNCCKGKQKTAGGYRWEYV